MYKRLHTPEKESWWKLAAPEVLFCVRFWKEALW